MPAKVTKLIGLKRPPFLSPTNLIIFACTQNGEYSFSILFSFKSVLFYRTDDKEGRDIVGSSQAKFFNKVFSIKIFSWYHRIFYMEDYISIVHSNSSTS